MMNSFNKNNKYFTTVCAFMLNFGRKFMSSLYTVNIDESKSNYCKSLHCTMLFSAGLLIIKKRSF